jgi:DNA invertase Pin-like site-specific DNA recombinase
MTTVTGSLHFGYARVSTDDQDPSLQVDALTKAGCQRIYSEVVSAGRKQRPKLDECLRTLRAGDTLTVWRLDRLGRNLTELVHIVTTLVSSSINFKSLSENIDTGSAAGNFTFQLFAAFAEFERNVLRERTKAGLEAARARGRMGGRKPKVTDQMIKEMKTLYDSRTIAVADICARYKITPTTFYRRVLGKNYDNRQKKLSGSDRL